MVLRALEVLMSTKYPPTLTGVDHQWTVSTNMGELQGFEVLYTTELNYTKSFY